MVYEPADWRFWLLEWNTTTPVHPDISESHLDVWCGWSHRDLHSGSESDLFAKYVDTHKEFDSGWWFLSRRILVIQAKYKFQIVHMYIQR